MRLWHHRTRRPWIAPAGLLCLSLLHPAALRINLGSDHIPHSWDSRYFGPVPEDRVIGRLQPLLTWPPFPHNTYGESTCRWNPTSF